MNNNAYPHVAAVKANYHKWLGQYTKWAAIRDADTTSKEDRRQARHCAQMYKRQMDAANAYLSLFRNDSGKAKVKAKTKNKGN